MLNLTMLPAAHGDAIWIEYGSGQARQVVLVDGGPAHTYSKCLLPRLQSLAGSRKVELLVVTHIDADHIDGALIFLQDRARLRVDVDEVWFNTWQHLPKPVQGEHYAPLQGEFLGGLIASDSKLAKALNRSFKSGAVCLPEDAPNATSPSKLPSKRLPGGALLTLLGPAASDLKRLRARWSSAIRDFSPGDETEAMRRLQERREYRPPVGPAVFSSRSFGDDRAPANGSSISFLFEYEGVSVLLAADSHARTLAAGLQRLCAERGVSRLAVDAVKLPHHGSMSNVTGEWLSLLDTRRWLVSTNGAVFGHPDVETARLVRECTPPSVVPELYFNYDSETTRRLRPAIASQWRAIYPTHKAVTAPGEGITLAFERGSDSAASRVKVI